MKIINCDSSFFLTNILPKIQGLTLKNKALEHFNVCAPPSHESQLSPVHTSDAERQRLFPRCTPAAVADLR